MIKRYLLVSFALAVSLPALSHSASLATPETHQADQISPDKHKLRWHERVLMAMAERRIKRKLEKMSWPPITTDCDTMLLSNGQTYLVQIIKTDDSQVQFVICDSIRGKTQTAPWSQIRHIRRVNGEMLVAPAAQPDEVLMKEAKAVRLMGLLSVPLLLLFGAGAILGVIAIIRGRKLLKKFQGNPQVRRVAKVGIVAGLISILILAAAVIFLLTNPFLA